jgi:hypothetical protein
MEHYNERGMAICQECGKELNILSKQHLKIHDMTFLEYKEKYPGYPTVSKSFSAKQRMKNVKLFEKTKEDILLDEPKKEIIKKEIEIEDFGDIELDKIPLVPKDYIEQVSDFIEEVKTFSKEQTSNLHYPDPNNIIHKDKIKFLNFLLTYFPDVKNSYFIDKCNNGITEERLVTDISIPSLRINIEFPNTFWHNIDIPKSSRDYKLKLLGWKVLDIPGTKPSMEEFKDILKKFKVI